MKSDCEKLDRWLQAYRDGELPLAEQHRVEAHTRSCPSCEARLAELQVVGFHLAETLLSEASTDAMMARLTEKVALKIAEIGEPPALTLWRRLCDPSRLALPLRLAATAAVLAIAVYALSLMGARPSDPTRSHQVQEAALSDPPIRVSYVRAMDPKVKVSFVDDREPQWTVVWISRTDSENR